MNEKETKYFEELNEYANQIAEGRNFSQSEREILLATFLNVVLMQTKQNDEIIELLKRIKSNTDKKRYGGGPL